MLDLCCFSGGFSIAAARAGAASVTGGVWQVGCSRGWDFSRPDWPQGRYSKASVTVLVFIRTNCPGLAARCGLFSCGCGPGASKLEGQQPSRGK